MRVHTLVDEAHDRLRYLDVGDALLASLNALKAADDGIAVAATGRSGKNGWLSVRLGSGPAHRVAGSDALSGSGACTKPSSRRSSLSAASVDFSRAPRASFLASSSMRAATRQPDASQAPRRRVEERGDNRVDLENTE